MQHASRLALVATVAALALLAIPGTASGAGLYGLDWNGTFCSVDPASAATTALGSTLDGAFGLGDWNGRLFTWDQNENRIRELSLADGSIIGTFDIGLAIGGEGALTFRADGIGFLGANPDKALYTFDLVAGTSTKVGDLTVDLDGLDFSPSGTLCGWSQLTHDLYTVDTGTAAVTLVGTTSLGSAGDALSGLTFGPGGPLWAESDNALYRVDPATAAVTLVGPLRRNLSGLSWVIPEPSTIALFAGGLLGLLGVVRRRRRS